MDSASTNSTTTVQHVTKKSSDELLRKFAEVEDDNDEAKKELKLSKRRKIRSKQARKEVACESPSHYSNSLVEKRSLLPPVTRKSVLLRQLGIGRSQLRARDFKNKSVFVAIEKTWRKTLEGASRVLLEKHYNRHRRLISDVA
ncbi:hypothetical protein JCGZ_25541 [Jatropha curcas]|uniref:Uncharacterized protein n=1 Tax=Jatropha curcas TaxID=180498 RepID=A0A067JX98_JATCU|nr:hypothetical protein JCGZ_25541 [Jatropha curcas]